MSTQGYRKALLIAAVTAAGLGLMLVVGGPAVAVEEDLPTDVALAGAAPEPPGAAPMQPPQGPQPPAPPGPPGHRQHAGPRPGRGHGDPMGRLLSPAFLERAVDLTDEQAKQVRQLRVTSTKAGIRRKAEAKIDRMDLVELLRDQKPDRKAVDRLVEKLQKARAEEVRERVDAVLKVKEILTPEQHEKLLKLLDRRGPRPGHHQPGGGPGPALPPPPGDGAPSDDPAFEDEMEEDEF